MHFSASPRRGLPKMAGDLLAVGIFAFGVGACAGVGYLAYAKFFKNKDSSAAVAEVASADEDRPASKQKTEAKKETCPGCQTPQPKSGEALPAKRKLAVPDENEMAGAWEYDFGSGTATLRIGEGAFQLIYRHGADGLTRRYARGTYTYDPETGVLNLVPRRELGAPEGVDGVSYSILTLRAYKIDVYEEKSSGDILWAPHVNAKGQGQVHPLFAFTETKDASIRWRPDA